MRLHAREQLAHAERLGDEVGCPEAERAHRGFLGWHRGNHEDGQVAIPGVVLYALQQLQPVDLRHHDVEEEQVELVGREMLEEMLAARNGNDFVAVLLEDPGERAGERLIVVGDENLRSERHSARETFEDCGIDVAAARDRDDRSLDRESTGPERGGRDGTGRLDGEAEGPVKVAHRGGDLGLADLHRLAHHAAHDLEGQRADRLRQQAIGNAVGAVEPDGMSDLERARQLRRTLGLDADHPDRWREVPDRRRDPGDQASTSNGHENRAHPGTLLEDLETAGALPRDHVGILVGRDHDETALPGDLVAARLALPSLLHERHLRPVASHPGLLDGGSVGRHHDHGGNTEVLRYVRDGLTVIAARVRHHAARALGRREAAHRSERAPDLERADRLELLALHERLESAADVGETREGSPDGNALERRCRSANGFRRNLGGGDRHSAAAGGIAASPVAAAWPRSSSFTTRATPCSLSPASRFMTRTPWVFRPITRIPSTGTRMMTPLCVIIMSSSSGMTSLSATITPVLSVTLKVMIPLPPRRCTRYSVSSERLP